MTAICGGGPSDRKAGVPDQVLIGGSGVAAFLSLIGKGKLSDILQIAVAGTNIATAAYCATDPPADPGLTATDLVDALNFGDPGAVTAASIRLSQWFLSQYWYQLCQCTTATTPAPPTPSDPGSPGTNTGLPPGAPSSCFSYNGTLSLTTPGGTLAVKDLGNQVFPPNGTPTSRNESSTTITWQLYPVPTGITTTTWSGVYPAPQATNTHTSLDIVWWPATGQPILHAALANATSNTATIGTNVAVPSGAVYWSLGVVSTLGPAGTFDFDLTMSASCGGQNFEQPCCPPDTSVDLRLRQIEQLLSQIYSIIPVRVPNYAAGTTHTGLTGNGTQTLDPTTIAVKLTVTTLPPAYGQVISEPDWYTGIGFITPVNNEGPESGFRLTRTTQIVPLPDATSSLDYSFPPGEVVDVQELQAG